MPIETSFNLYVLQSNSCVFLTVDIYQDKDKRRYIKYGSTEIFLEPLKIKHLRDYVHNEVYVPDINKLKLWKLNGFEYEDIKEKHISTEDDIIQKLHGEEMGLDKPFSKYFQVELDDYVPVSSIITIIPATTDLENLERKRKTVQDVSIQIIDKLRKRPRMTLPKIESLEGLIDKELSEEMKLPLTQREFDMLLSTDINDICGSDDLRVLFRVSETESALHLCSCILFAPILSKLPPNDGTEYSFVELWDSNIRKPLEIFVYNSTYVRNSSRNMSTGSERPDYGLILNHVCPFRGEEKSPSNNEDPKTELARKLVWTYDPAPYVLGYYANGPLVTFVAISRPPEGDDVSYVRNIITSNLASRRERIFHLRRIINLSKIIELVQEVIGFRETAEFIPIVREGRQIIEVCGKNIKKRYISPDAHDRVERLVNIYGKLEQKRVPNVDSIEHIDKKQDAVYLSPKGISVKPKDQQELLDSITCVLEMLMVLHDNEPIYHQDIRWPNIIRLSGALDKPSKWIIIDWEDADGYPNDPAKHLTPSEHAPEVFRQNHGGEVDIWSVGKLIIDASYWIIGLSQGITQFGRDLQSNDRPTAKEALKRFKKMKKNLKKNLKKKKKILKKQ